MEGAVGGGACRDQEASSGPNEPGVSVKRPVSDRQVDIQRRSLRQNFALERLACVLGMRCSQPQKPGLDHYKYGCGWRGGQEQRPPLDGLHVCILVSL